MDRDIIYLDNDDEITSVVDKMKGSDFGALDLVIPKGALILQSVVNLKLLKKQAESLSKEITIVTQDRVGKKLAEQIGIPVVEKQGQVPKEVHLTEGEPAVPAEVDGDEVVEFKKKAPKAAPAEEEADGIEMKENAVLDSTSEVVGAGAAEAVMDAGVATADSSEEAVEEAGDEPVQLLKKDDLAKGKKKKRWKLYGIIGGFAALALFVAAYIFLPMATVEIHLAAEKKKVDFTFTADKSYTKVDTTAQTLPAQVVTIEQEKSQKYTATGKKKVGTKATGTITISDNGYNTYPTSTTIVAGSRFVAANGLVFRSTTNITVPGLKISQGVPTAGKADVTVESDQFGSNYNLGVTTFTVPALGTDKISGANTSAFTGGSSRDVTYVTQEDVNSAKEDIGKQLETDLKKAVTEKIERNQRYLDGASKIEQESATPSVAVNGEAAEFTLAAKSKITAIVFNDADLTKLAESVLGDQIGSGKEIVEKDALTAESEFVEGDFTKGTIKAKLSGEAYIAAKIEQNKLKTQIAGESNAIAIKDIKAIDGVDDATITRQFPSFLKRVPRINSHIFIKVILNKS